MEVLELVVRVCDEIEVLSLLHRCCSRLRNAVRRKCDLFVLCASKGICKGVLPPPTTTTTTTMDNSMAVLRSMVLKATRLHPRFMARLMFDYVATDATELSAVTGESVWVLQEDESGWWKCVIVGAAWRVGFLPSEFLEMPVDAPLPEDGVWVIGDKELDPPPPSSADQQPQVVLEFGPERVLRTTGMRLRSCQLSNGDRVVSLQDFLSEAECARWISLADACGWKPNRSREIFRAPFDESTLNHLWLRIKPHTLARLTANGKDYQRGGLSPEMRMFRYEGIAACAPLHRDGGPVDSFFSLVVYLSPTFGARTIFDTGKGDTLAVEPQQGEALLFPHTLRHRAEVPHGVKVVLRCDVVYRWSAQEGPLIKKELPSDFFAPPPPVDPFELLPLEICVLVLLNLDTHEVLNARLVNRRWAAVCRNESLWQKFSEEKPKKDEACKSPGDLYQDYQALLQQNNIGNNNNKFYVCEVHTLNGSYSLWTRWGRCGQVGQSCLRQCRTLDVAIQAFQQKFMEKTGRDWSSREQFVPKDSKYVLVDFPRPLPVERPWSWMLLYWSRKNRGPMLDRIWKSTAEADAPVMKTIIFERDFDPAIE